MQVTVSQKNFAFYPIMGLDRPMMCHYLCRPHKTYEIYDKCVKMMVKEGLTQLFFLFGVGGKLAMWSGQPPHKQQVWVRLPAELSANFLDQMYFFKEMNTICSIKVIFQIK